MGSKLQGMYEAVKAAMQGMGTVYLKADHVVIVATFVPQSLSAIRHELDTMGLNYTVDGLAFIVDPQDYRPLQDTGPREYAPDAVRREAYRLAKAARVEHGYSRSVGVRWQVREDDRFDVTLLLKSGRVLATHILERDGRVA